MIKLGPLRSKFEAMWVVEIKELKSLSPISQLSSLFG